ncbi:unnamed protein product [Pylaiella littoralis]
MVQPAMIGMVARQATLARGSNTAAAARVTAALLGGVRVRERQEPHRHEHRQALQQRRWFSAQPAAQRKKSVMFVCKRNSCRSQMAEGWAKHMAKDDLEICSSGLEGSRVHPTAKAVMQEVGVDITSHTSDFLHHFEPSQFDAVVSMCGCGTSLPEPWQKAGVFEDWQLDDPDGEPLETFRRVRTEIKDHVEALVEKIDSGKATTQEERDAMAKSPSEC